jgi:hypothetical protein
MAAEKKPSKPDPAAPMLFFFIVTSIYCVVSIFMGGGDTKTKIIMKVAYILFVITGEYFINLNLSHALCGENQWRSVFFITIVPWLFIFSLLHVFLFMFPGWMSPFANTFGYLVVKLMGLPELMKDIIAPIGGEAAQRAIVSITTDDSLLINQFSPEAATETHDKNGVRTKKREKYYTAWANLQKAGIIKTVDPSENELLRKKFYKFIEMKYTISEYVWNILTGFLVTSVSYNYIINTGCEKSVEDMKRRHDEYEAAQKEKKAKESNKQANEPNYRQAA